MMEDGGLGEAGDSVPVPDGDLTVVRQQLRYHERDIALTGILHIYNSEELGINEVVHHVLDLPEKKSAFQLFQPRGETSIISSSHILRHGILGCLVKGSIIIFSPKSLCSGRNSKYSTSDSISNSYFNE